MTSSSKAWRMIVVHVRARAELAVYQALAPDDDQASAGT